MEMILKKQKRFFYIFPILSLTRQFILKKMWWA